MLSDRLLRGVRRARLDAPPERPRAAPPAHDPRARRRPRPARHGRRRLVTARRVLDRLPRRMSHSPAHSLLSPRSLVPLASRARDRRSRSWRRWRWAPAGTRTPASRPAPTPGESGQNAPYLNVGPLVYEVQLSRELNPANVEDAAYLQGLTPAQRTLKPGEEWFAVFIQVYNHTSTAHLGASNVTISDTQNNVYTPIVPGPDQPVRLPRRVSSPPTARSPAQHDRRQRRHPGRAAALQDPGRLARQPPADDSHRRSDRTRLRPRRPSSTSSGCVACSPASSTCRATGAAVAPPAPSLTSSTPTTMRGCSAGANAANQASVLLASLAAP